MRIHSYPFGLLVPAGKHDVCCFSRHTGKSDQIIHVIRDLTRKIFNDLSGRTDDTLGFVPEKTCRTDLRFQFCPIGTGKVPSGLVLCKQHGCELIDSLIRALGREDGCHKDFEGSAEHKCRPALWVCVMQYPDDLTHTLLCTLHFGSPRFGMYHQRAFLSAQFFTELNESQNIRTADDALDLIAIHHGHLMDLFCGQFVQDITAIGFERNSFQFIAGRHDFG
jgi:hypothetical protein